MYHLLQWNIHFGRAIKNCDNLTQVQLCDSSRYAAEAKCQCQAKVVDTQGDFLQQIHYSSQKNIHHCLNVPFLSPITFQQCNLYQTVVGMAQIDALITKFTCIHLSYIVSTKD